MGLAGGYNGGKINSQRANLKSLRETAGERRPSAAVTGRSGGTTARGPRALQFGEHGEPTSPRLRRPSCPRHYGRNPPPRGLHQNMSFCETNPPILVWKTAFINQRYNGLR